MVELSAVVGDERNLVHQKLTLVTALTVTSVCSNCAPVLQEQEREKAGSGVARGPDYHRFITTDASEHSPLDAPCAYPLLRTYKNPVLSCSRDITLTRLS